jgi:diaminohydroxyphosphoribosylaminopyrimidine deaminase/5-amino-6-(5-phosphoribosylamino)uracil reductase
MQRCLQLAQKGLGQTAPNPLVGCVIVADEKIIGEGFHEKFGEAHAEVNALNKITDESLLRNATLYVNLEPCAHFGKTPPCADLIVAKKIPRVVIGSTDPNPLVAGKGIQRLRNAGIEVTENILEDSCNFLNRRFFTFHQHKRPYIILKWAESADKKMALSEPKQFWFTGNEAQQLSHRWRTEEQAILIGRRTVEIDDCELTARLWQGKNPLRIAIDRKLSLSLTKKIFNSNASTLVFNEIKNEASGTLTFSKINFEQNVLPQILNELYLRQIQSVIVEGGAETLQHFLQQNLWDEARIFTSPTVLVNGISSPTITKKFSEEPTIGADTLRIYFNSHL